MDLISEISIKEITSESHEFAEQIKKLHSNFETKLAPNDGCFSKKIDITDKPRCIHTINEFLEGQKHPDTGVPFDRRVIDLPSGQKIEGVFPRFDSAFDAKISEEYYLKSDYIQFKECNKQLYDALENNPELKSKFSLEQIEQIKDGISDGSAPDGYVWHHDAESGKLQLVDSNIHAKTNHTGGRFVWGGGSDYR